MRRMAALVLVVIVCASAGCVGYRARSVFREDIRTVYVAGFDNQTFRRGLEVFNDAMEMWIWGPVDLTEDWH